MGNINYNNYICENYYCQSVSFKPEWLSENSWNINYKYLYDDYNLKKPYTIDKGILKIKDVSKNNILLSKRMFVNFSDIKNISIPINFRYNLNNNSKISLYILLSDNELLLNTDKDIIFNNLFFINLIFTKKYIYISNSFNTHIIKKKIKSNKINIFDINIENNYNMLLITEKLLSVFEEKYLCNFSFDENKEYYLHLYIKNENDLYNNQFIELNFE